MSPLFHTAILLYAHPVLGFWRYVIIVVLP
jgi:hypothetical protein